MTPGSPRRLRTLALMILAALIAASCSSAEAEVLAYQNDRDTTRLRIATTDPAGLLAGVAAWERTHPTVTVEIDVHTSGDLLRLVLAEDEGETPDIVTLNPQTRPTAITNPALFLDLIDDVDERLLSAQLPGLVDAGRANGGELVGVPLSSDAIGLAVRTDLLGDDHLEQARTAESWCELIEVADRFSAESKIAFFGDPTELAKAQFAQSRAGYVDRTDGLIGEDRAELEEIWDLTMSSLGVPPVHGDPCPNHGDVDRISRNFTFGDSLWASAADADGFAASLVSYRDLDELAAAAPDSTGAWTVLPAPGSAGASDGLIHLAVPAEAKNKDLAIDLIATLTSPQVQQMSFAEQAPTLPTTSAFYEGEQSHSTLDAFFGEGALDPFAAAVLSRPSDTDPSSERETVIELMLGGIRDVANDSRSPQDAWDDMIERVQ